MFRYYDRPEEKTEKIQLPVDQVTVGMHVVELDRPWGETTFVFQGFVVGNAEELRQLQAQCHYVYVEVTRELRHAPPGNVGAGGGKRSDDITRPPLAERIKWVSKVPVEREFTKAKGTFDDARKFAKNALESLRMGLELDLDEAKSCVTECVDSLLRNDNAMLFLLQKEQ